MGSVFAEVDERGRQDEDGTLSDLFGDGGEGWGG